MTPQEITREFCGEFYVPWKRYSAPLPAELETWYCYTSDGGHSIACLLEGLIKQSPELWQQLCPVPVKTVLRGWRTEGQFVVVTTGFKYTDQLGLQVDPADDEF